MPIYEFYCPDNRKIYSFLARSLAYSDKTPRCPENPKFRMEKMLSNFAVTGRAKEKPEMPGDTDDPRLDSALAEMEQEMAGLDESNPDPRHLARMIRKMTSLSGEKFPREMEEMVSRMESGEDPEKLEQEYGDVFDNIDASGEGADEPGGDGVKAALRALRRRPVRDPVLYEMSDYVK